MEMCYVFCFIPSQMYDFLSLFIFAKQSLFFLLPDGPNTSFVVSSGFLHLVGKLKKVICVFLWKAHSDQNRSYHMLCHFFHIQNFIY